MFDFDDIPEEEEKGGSETGPPEAEKPKEVPLLMRGDFDPYGMLGIPPDATDSAIKSAFRKASLKIHPDRNPSPEAAAQFRDLMGAKEFLLTPEKRLWYNLKHGLGQVTTNVKWWLNWDELFDELEPSELHDAEVRAPGPASALPEGRAVDVLIFGATGCTGMLACAYAEQLGGGRTWSIAGRDERKLRLLEQKFGRRAAGFRGAARLEAPEDAERLAASARVVVDLSGPKFRVGSFVAEACVRAGTHYVDVSGFEGDVLHARKVRDKLDAAARQAGVSLVFFCGAYQAQVDFDAWFMAKQLREEHGVRIRRLDVYQSYQHFVMGGSSTQAYVGPKDYESEVKEYVPFILGGEVGKRGFDGEDEDLMEMSQDEKHPELWLYPGEYNAGTAVTRCSVGLFDGSEESWGPRLCFKIWDVHISDKQAGENTILVNKIFRRGYDTYAAAGKCAPPGSGARERVRKEGVPTRIYVAEADEAKSKSRRRRFHMVTRYGPGGWGNPDEGSAAMAVDAAHCLLDGIDGGLSLRPGFGTPTWHLAHLGFHERVAARGTSSGVKEGYAPLALFETVKSGALNLEM